MDKRLVMTAWLMLGIISHYGLKMPLVALVSFLFFIIELGTYVDNRRY